jgi:hypothetical protein
MALRAVATLAPRRPLAALVHLLTPRRCVLGLNARLDDGTLTFRSASVTLDEGDLPRAARRVAALVEQVSADTDTFCNLRSSAARWVKPTRSGTIVLLAGSRELFDAPTVRVDADVAQPGLLAELGHALAAGQLNAGALPAAMYGTALERDGDVVLVRACGTRKPSAAVYDEAELLLEAARSCSVLDGAFGAVDAQWSPQPATFPGTVHILGRLELADGTTLEVPLTQSSSCRMAGVPAGQILAGAPDAAAPDGFTTVGMRLRDGAVVVEHARSGVRAALTRSAVAVS